MSESMGTKIDYEIIDIDGKKDLMFCGDIHGLFSEFVHRIVDELKLENLNVVVCGDFGVGFYKEGYYKELFGKLGKKLKKRDITIYALRGNHDNPEYFNNKEIRERVMDKCKGRIVLVSDYSVLRGVRDDESGVEEYNNILCIGGARSIDKMHRMKWDFHSGKMVYDGWWDGEMINDIPDGWKEWLDGEGIRDINWVCSHSSPDFCEPLCKRGLEFWSMRDENLIEECERERKLLSDIYKKLKDWGYSVKNWMYGHFHNSYILIDGNNDVLFRGLDMFGGDKRDDFYFHNNGDGFALFN